MQAFSTGIVQRGISGCFSPQLLVVTLLHLTHSKAFRAVSNLLYFRPYFAGCVRRRNLRGSQQVNILVRKKLLLAGIESIQGLALMNVFFGLARLLSQVSGLLSVPDQLQQAAALIRRMNIFPLHVFRQADFYLRISQITDDGRDPLLTGQLA